jgi:hypothetical protein
MGRRMRLEIKALISASILAPVITVWPWAVVFLVSTSVYEATGGAVSVALAVLGSVLSTFPLAGLAALMGFVPAMALLSLPFAIASRWGSPRGYGVAGFVAAIVFVSVGWIGQAHYRMIEYEWLETLGWLAFPTLAWAPFSLAPLPAATFTLSALVAGVATGRLYAAAVGASGKTS